MRAAEILITQHGAKPDSEQLATVAIQAAIDAAAKAGGGVVRIPRGRFISGRIQLKDNIRLIIEKGAVLRGSPDCKDYGGQGKWDDALITGENLKHIRIEGEGEIDGADCKNPTGEEGFRGPHGMLLTGCGDIVIKDVTFERTGNYAILCRHCTRAEFRKVSFRGGHDGIHAQVCGSFTVRDCDIRTGDDCFAGSDNTDFVIVNCKVNSSCNGFRLGCVNLLVQGCQFWGPGEFMHLVTKRTNMLAAFTHFAPSERTTKLPSDNWLVQDCTIDNADNFYLYDIEKPRWQTAQPAKRLRFQNVTATRLAQTSRVLGDAGRQFELTLDNVSLALREDRADQEVLDLTRFGSLVLRDVTLKNSGKKPVLRAQDGKLVWFDHVTCVPASAAPFAIEQVDETRQE